MVGVSLREQPETVREWGEDFGIGYPLWLDPWGQSPGAFGLQGHPSTVLIDRRGRIVGRVPGERDWSTPEARRLVEWLLAESGR